MRPNDRIHRAILEQWPLELWQDSTVVIAVSGGADSTALLQLIFDLRPDPQKTIVAHYNHALRGDESDADQAFVESHAQRLGLPCVVERADVCELSNKSENTLRGMRHAFLKNVSRLHDASWIALAHQADDQVETFLHNLLRGSGPSGLSAIPSVRAINATTNLVRPMLRIRRSAILEYLENIQQPYRIDSSNASSDYTRNRIRNDLLPMLRTFSGSGSVDERLLQACELIAEEHRAIEEGAKRWLVQLGRQLEATTESGQSQLTISLKDFSDVSWPVIRHGLTLLWHRMEWPLREMNHRHWRKLQHLLQRTRETTHPQRLELPGRIVVQSRRGMLHIMRSSG